MIQYNIPQSPRRFKEWESSDRLVAMSIPLLFGDPPAPSSSESTSDIITSLTRYLPDYMKVQNEQLGPQSQAQLNAAQQISPAYAKLASELYSIYGPQLARTSGQVENINRTAAANTDLDILKGSGGQLATEAQRIDKQLNPEFYNTRAAAGSKIGELLGSINLNDPNPEAERLVNQENARSGNLATPSSTGTVANALSFGNEEQKRRDALGQALGQATNFLQPSQGSFNPIVTALNRPSTNAGQGQFTGVTNPSNQAYQSGGQLAGQIGTLVGQKNDINANRRDALDRVNETLTGIGSIVSV
jgi:hypothetical protein